MRRTVCLTALLALVVVLSGCVMPAGASVMAPIMDAKGPMLVGDTADAGYSKVGKATSTGIILVALGDSSISAAMKDGGITKVHHVDYEVLNVLNIYVKMTTVVYGD